jgi:hypothetical protein
MSSLLNFLNINFNFCFLGDILVEKGYELIEADLKYVYYIDLHGRKIKELPTNFDKLYNLRKIELSNNELENIPEVLFNLVELIDIRINRNKLTQIHNNISKFNNLECFYAGRNMIQIIPDGISELKKLNRLHLRNNKINLIPQTFVKLINLKELDLSENHIEELPEDFHKLASLEQLYLSGNKISILPPDFFKLSKLKGLSLSANNIVKLDPSITNLKSLIYLWLHDNPLKDPPLYIADDGFLKIKCHFNKKYGMLSKCFLTGGECSKSIIPQESQLFIAYCFSKKANDIISLAIEPAAKKAKLKPIKAVDRKDSIDFMCKICHMIQESKYIIADLSNYDNKSTFNVGFELGIACGLGKKTFLICQRDVAQPSDLKRNEILYFDEISVLKEELAKMFIQSK